MGRLTRRDLRTLLEFIRESYVTCDLDSFAQRVISRLPKLVPSEITTYNEVSLRRHLNACVAYPQDAYWAAENKIFERHMHEHPVIMRHRKRYDNRALKISDFLSQNQFHRLGLYNEFYRPLNVEDQMSFVLPSPPPLIIGIALNRSRPDFSERDRTLLNLLSPHLIQAYRNAEAVTQMQGQLALMQHTLEKLDQGVIVLTRDGRVVRANDRAIQWLRDYFGNRSVRANRLPENLRLWLSHQKTLLAAKDDLPPPQKPLVVEREAKRLVVRHLSACDPPAGRAGAQAGLCDSAQWLLLFEEQQTEASPQLFEGFGLSHREAEVLLWVACGKTNAEIGMILGLSPRTVQKHLERIFQKLGVENRTAAAAKAHEIASGFTRK